MHIYHVQPGVVLLEVLTYRLRSGKKIPRAFSLDFLPGTPWEGLGCREHKVFHLSGSQEARREGADKIVELGDREGSHEIIKRG